PHRRLRDPRDPGSGLAGAGAVGGADLLQDGGGGRRAADHLHPRERVHPAGVHQRAHRGPRAALGMEQPAHLGSDHPDHGGDIGPGRIRALPPSVRGAPDADRADRRLDHDPRPDPDRPAVPADAGAGSVDTYWGIILPQVVAAPMVFILKKFFDQIPYELEEAALVDGASRFRIFWNIVLPLSRPILGAVAIFVFIGAWNNFLWPFIVINDSNLMT